MLKRTCSAGLCVGWALALLLLGCAEHHTQDVVRGGETHFLMCEQDADCAALGEGFFCGAELVCEEPAGDAAESAGADCEGARCEDAPGASGGDQGGDGTSAMSSGSGEGAGTTGTTAVVPDDAPLVMFLVDSSGSMERRARCPCETPGCAECLPSCAPGATPNRWGQLLAALTGSFEDFACEAVERTADNGMTYDEGYYLPYHRLLSSAQRDDGVMDEFASRVRFGSATFDGWDTYVGAPPLVEFQHFDVSKSRAVQGLWSYDPRQALPSFLAHGDGLTGVILYPSGHVPYFMDTGVRSAIAEEGALRVAGDAASALAINADIQADLRSVRPYGGTPIAAALQDLNLFLRNDPDAAAERAGGERGRHLVLITDGYPDDDYRSFGCTCRTSEDPDACQGDDSDMSCPFPTPEGAAHALRCGTIDADAACDDGIIDALHVVAFSVTDDDEGVVLARLDAIAQSGGSSAARIAEDGEALRQTLRTLLGEILAGD